jgi:hypothetical protein
MDINSFRESLSAKLPPGSFPPYLTALWYDAKGDWNAAHNEVDDLEGKDAAWVHAYLHRKEGDQGNAGYWYRRAGKEPCLLSLQEEWTELVSVFLDR